MAVISGYNSSSISALFAGLNSGNSSSSFGIGSIDLSTYNSIRTGTYKQLLKSYYAKNPVKDSSKTDSGSTTTISSQKINAAKTKDAASAVVDDAQDLKSVSLWNKKSVKNEDGTTSDKYDTDAIYKAVSSFVKDYNSLIEAAGDSEDNSVLRTASNVVNNTKQNSALLKKLGIMVDSKNKLSIDETTFKNADMAVAKSVFASTASYGQSVASSASGRMTVLPPNSTALHISAKRLLSAKYSFAFRSFAPIHLLLCDVLLFNFLLHWVYRDETPMTDSGHKIYFPFMTGTYVIRLPYFPAAVNLLASFIFQQIQFCYPANS